MLVTREADYAIRCVIEVARIGRTSAAQVARLQGISPTFLGKIVQTLAKAGILATRRGVGGGIALAKPVEDITLLEVIEAVEGPLCINECLQTPTQCALIGECPAYPYLSEAQARLKETLDVSFATVVAAQDPAPELAPTAISPTDLDWIGTGNGQRRSARTADPAARGEA